MSHWIASHIAPDRAEVEANAVNEPEGERLRRELEAWLDKNKILGIFLDTPNHRVEIDWAHRLPPEIRSVLTIWGAISIIWAPSTPPKEER